MGKTNHNGEYKRRLVMISYQGSSSDDRLGSVAEVPAL